MNEQLKNLCEQYIRNRDIIKAAFPWDTPDIIALSAMVFSNRNIAVNPEKLKECRKLLEHNTSIFSNFRGNTKLPTVSQLACTEDAAGTMQNAMGIYSVLKEYLSGSDYLAYLSTILTGMMPREKTEEMADHARTIFKAMRKKHPFLSGDEDFSYAILMTFLEKSDETLLTEMEECFKLLKPHFFHTNAVQMLSHVLTFGEGTVEARCDKLLALYNGLCKAKVNYGTTYHMAILGSLSLADVPAEQLCEEIVQVDAFLSEQKGYGLFSIDSSTRAMHGAMLVSILHNPTILSEVSAVTGCVAMVAAQVAATTMLLTAAT